MSGKKIGRPTDYTKELAEEICLKISTTTDGLVRLCAQNPHWPVRETIFCWRLKYEEFSIMYHKAKQNQIEAMVDDIVEIADNGENDTLTRRTKDGDEYDVCNNEWVNRSRLRVESRKWLAAKLVPRLYGEKLHTETKVDIESMTKEELEKIVNALSAETKLKLVDVVVEQVKAKKAEKTKKGK